MLKIFAIPWFSSKSLIFSDREKEPRSDAVAVPPPAPLSSVWLFIWIKKWDRENFFALANSREIQCEHHLVAILFVCGKFLLEGSNLMVFIWSRPSQGELGRRGRGTSAFEMVLFPAKAIEL